MIKKIKKKKKSTMCCRQKGYPRGIEGTARRQAKTDLQRPKEQSTKHWSAKKIGMALLEMKF